MPGNVLEVQQQYVFYFSCTLINLLKILLVAAVMAGQSMRFLLCVGVRSVVALVDGHQFQAIINVDVLCVIDEVHTFSDVLSLGTL